MRMAGLFSRRYLQSLININKSFNVKSMSYYNMQHANCALMPISQLLIKTNTNSFLNSRISKTVFSPHLGHNSLLKSNFTSSKWGWNKKSETVPSESEQPKKQGIVARFKELTRKYWYVLVPVHLVTSAGWLTGFYYLSTSGVDMVALLQALSINETIIENMKDSSMGHYAITYMCYKIATPVRYTVTIGGTTISIKYLSKWGYIKPMPTKEELQKMYDDKKAEMKQNFDDKKAQMIQDIEDRKTQMLQDFDDKKAQIKQGFDDKKSKMIEQLQNKNKLKK